MKFVIALSMLIAGSAFAKDGLVTCTLTVEANGKSTVVGELTIPENSHGEILYEGYSALSYVSPVCESAQPCRGYKLTSILTRGQERLVVKGEYTNEESGKVIAGQLVTTEGSATTSCTVL